MIVSSSFEIQGADNIQQHISTMLHQSEERLCASCEPFAAEMLFAVLEGANYICLDLVKSKQGGYFTLTIPVLEALHWFTVALDPLLRLSGGSIRAPSKESLETLLKRLIVIVDAMSEVQFWRQVQEVHKVEPMEFVVANGDKLLDTEQPEFYTALKEVMNKLDADVDWLRYFREHILAPQANKERLLYEGAFRQHYGLEASDFATLVSYFQGVAQSHSQRVASLQIPLLESNRPDINASQEFPQAMNIVFGIIQGAMPTEKPPRFTPLCLREQALADLQSEMHGTKDKAQKWLKELEYHPGLDIFRHPLIPLTKGDQQIYALLPWMFYPIRMCSEQWDGELFMRQTPRNKWAKTMGGWYGNGFSDYVTKMLREIGITDLRTEQNISGTEFGNQLTPWLRQLEKAHNLPEESRKEFTPDIILQKDDTVLVISCKAEDLYFNYWLLQNYLFMPASKMRRAIEKNTTAIREVCIWGECIASIKDVRQRLGIQAKRILPILVTSRKEPLSSPVLRRYLAQREAIPAVPAVTTDELKVFITLGFDVSVLPLPFPPIVLYIS